MTQAQRNPERPLTALLAPLWGLLCPRWPSTQLERRLQGSPGMATTRSGTLWRRSSGDETGLGDECSLLSRWVWQVVFINTRNCFLFGFARGIVWIIYAVISGI